MPTGPQGRERKRVETTYLRVPFLDWPAVKHGYKTEFRMLNSNRFVRFRKLILPTPVVGYKSETVYEETMLVLHESWIEPLGAISEESLEHEGFESMAHFRRYWTDRTKTRFRPLDRVQVFRVALYTPDQREMLGGLIFDRLYGEFTGVDTERLLLSRRGPLSAGVR